MHGVIKDFHERMIPENKASDCNNVIFKNGRVRRRFGFMELGPMTLNGAITGITFYEQVRLGDKFCLVFTARDAYLYDTTTGAFSLISITYSTGTASANVLAVAGSGTSWSGALTDVYSIKFGTNSGSVNSISFTADASQFTSFGTAVYNMKSAALSSTASIVVYDNGTNTYARVVTYSGGTFTVGAETLVVSSRTNPSVGVYSATVAAVMYSGGAKACSISGTTITFGSGVSLGGTSPSGFVYSVLFLSASDVVFLSYTSPVPGLDYFTLSGTTLTHVYYAYISGSWSLTYKSVVGFAVSSTSFVVSMRTGGSAVYFAKFSISGGVFVLDYADSVSTSDLCYLDGCVNISSTRSLLCGRNASGSPYSVLLNDSGSAFSLVTSLRLSSSTGRYLGDIKAIDSSHYVVLENYSTMRSRLITVSGDTLTNANTTTLKTLGSLYASQSVACAVLSTTTVLFFFGDGSASYYGKGTPLTIDISADTIALGGTSTVLTSPSALTNLYVGLQLTATFLQAGTRIKSIDWAGSTITIDRPVTAEATGGAISADISDWYLVDTIGSVTSITLNALLTFSGTTTNSSAVVTGIADTSVLHVGMGLSGSGIPSSATSPTYILSIDSATQITMSANATASATVTITAGLAISSSHLVNYVLTMSFSGDDDDFWSFAYPYNSTLEEKMLVASNGVDAMVKWDGTGAIETLTGSPPATAKYIGYYGAAMFEHFIAAWTTDSGNNLAQTIEVSDAGDAESWTGGAYYDLLQTNDEIIGIEILKNRLVVYKRKSISMAWPTPEGSNDDPFDWEQDTIVDLEIPCGRTVVNFGDYHLFLGEDNVYKFNGISLEPVGTEVINTMKNEWNGAHMDHSFAIAITNENLYCIFIPTLAEYDDDGNETKAEAEYPDRAYVFNYEERTWTIWNFPVQFTCAGYVNKGYTPTVDAIDALDRSYAQMDMRWADLISYSKVESLLIGDTTGHIYEMRDAYDSDNGVNIDALFVTRDFPLNDPKRVFFLCELVIGYARQLAGGDIRVRASVDFGENWSNYVTFTQLANPDYIEYICNFMMRGRQVRFEFSNVLGSNFNFESFIVGYNDNDEQGVKRFNA